MSSIKVTQHCLFLGNPPPFSFVTPFKHLQMEIFPSANYLSFRIADDYLTILESKLQPAVEVFVPLKTSDSLSKLFGYRHHNEFHESLTLLIAPMVNRSDFFLDMLGKWKNN